MSRGTIARWESGNASAPDLAALRSVCETLNRIAGSTVASPYRAGQILGLLPPRGGEDNAMDPTVSEVVAILQDETVDPAIKDEWVDYLRWRVGKERARRSGRPNAAGTAG